MERSYYIQPWKLLQNEAHQGIVDFAALRAKKLGVELAVCVHNKNSCEQFLQKCFGESGSRSLLNRKPIKVHGVSVTLESVKTLKNKHFSTERVYLALFPSVDLMDALEAIESNKSLIVFSETQHSEHLVQWYQKHEAKALTAQQLV